MPANGGYQGMRWHRSDLHLHTPADRSHWRDRTIAADEDGAVAYARRCYEMGLDVIGVTDHNFASKDFIPLLETALDRMSSEYGRRIILFPGFEMTAHVGKGIHVLALFEPGTPPDEIDHLLTECGVPYPRPVDGAPQPSRLDLSALLAVLQPAASERLRSLLVAHCQGDDALFNDDKVAEWLQRAEFTNEKLLAVEVPKPVRCMKNGWQKLFGLAPGCDPKWERKRRIACLMSSDADRLAPGTSPDEKMGIGWRYSWIKMSAPSIEALRQACLDPESRIRLPEDTGTDRSPDDLQQNARIVSLSVSGAAFLRDQVVHYVHQTRDGRFLRRVGSHRRPIPAETRGRMLAGRGLALPFEERPAIGAPLAAVDRARFEAFYERRFGAPFASATLPMERLLVNLKLAKPRDDGGLVPTNVGLLLFADDPSQWIDGAFVDVAVYDHAVADGNTRDAKRVTGPVHELASRLLDYFAASPLAATVSEKTGRGRLDRPAYSLLALQEAVVNALVHRDYEVTGSQVIVTMFPDRVEVANPGGLFNTLTPEDLYAGCLPVRRNQILAAAVRDYPSPVTGLRLMESRGEGFLNLVRECVALSGRRPELVVRGNAVRLTIFAAAPEPPV